MKSSALALALALASCSSTAPVGVDASHPASPEAEAAPSRAPLQALTLDGTELSPTVDSDPRPDEPSAPPIGGAPHSHSHRSHPHAQ